MKTMATNMIIKDMKDAGFSVRKNLNGDCLVELNRTISIVEVETALLDAGYDESQFDLECVYSGVVVYINY